MAQANQRSIDFLPNPAFDTNSTRPTFFVSGEGVSRLIVVDGDRLEGIISLKDMLEFLSLKVELEEIV